MQPVGHHLVELHVALDIAARPPVAEMGIEAEGELVAGEVERLVGRARRDRIERRLVVVIERVEVGVDVADIGPEAGRAEIEDEIVEFRSVGVVTEAEAFGDVEEV